MPSAVQARWDGSMPSCGAPPGTAQMGAGERRGPLSMLACVGARQTPAMLTDRSYLRSRRIPTLLPHRSKQRQHQNMQAVLASAATHATGRPQQRAAASLRRSSFVAPCSSWAGARSAAAAAARSRRPLRVQAFRYDPRDPKVRRRGGASQYRRGMWPRQGAAPPPPPPPLSSLAAAAGSADSC